MGGGQVQGGNCNDPEKGRGNGRKEYMGLLLPVADLPLKGAASGMARMILMQPELKPGSVVLELGSFSHSRDINSRHRKREIVLSAEVEKLRLWRKEAAGMGWGWVEVSP